MKKSTKTILASFAVSVLTCCFLFASFSFGQEMPKPGEVIDKGNYKKYQHLFPEFFLPGFEDGWGGLFKPLSIKVSETKPGGQPKAYLALSEKNRGKYTIDKDGFIAGGYDYTGLPFPGVTPDDKDFANKLMYNYRYKYWRDDLFAPSIQYSQRKGEAATYLIMVETSISFINRMYEAPKPFYKTPDDLEYALILHDTYPPDIKDFMTMTHRYRDPKKRDDVYLYIPALRRVLRSESGQRSTPIQGIMYALDDFFGGFDGRTFEFTYKFLKEQKVLACTETNLNVELAKKMHKEIGGRVPFPVENWSLRDVYVIEITPKEAKYPQSKKIVYFDKEGLVCLYTAAYDRGGKLWKIFGLIGRRDALPDGDTQLYLAGQWGADLQFGLGTTFMTDFFKLTGNGIKYTDIMPSALVKKVR